jgi:hypothetical protein
MNNSFYYQSNQYSRQEFNNNGPADTGNPDLSRNALPPNGPSTTMISTATPAFNLPDPNLNSTINQDWSNTLPRQHRQPDQQHQQRQHQHEHPGIHRSRSWEDERRNHNDNNKLKDGNLNGSSWGWDYNNTDQHNSSSPAPHRFPLPHLPGSSSLNDGPSGMGLRHNIQPLHHQQHQQHQQQHQQQMSQPHTSMSLRESYDQHHQRQQQQQQMLQQSNAHLQQRQPSDHIPINTDMKPRDPSSVDDDQSISQQDQEDQLEGGDKKPRRQRRRNGQPPRDLALRKYSCLLCIEEPRAFARPSALKIHMVRTWLLSSLILVANAYISVAVNSY